MSSKSTFPNWLHDMRSVTSPPPPPRPARPYRSPPSKKKANKGTTYHHLSMIDHLDLGQGPIYALVSY